MSNSISDNAMLGTTVVRIGDDELPEPHAWAVVRTDSTVYAFVKRSGLPHGSRGGSGGR